VHEIQNIKTKYTSDLFMVCGNVGKRKKLKENRVYITTMVSTIELLTRINISSTFHQVVFVFKLFNIKKTLYLVF
jgi:hypothetical protein